MGKNIMTENIVVDLYSNLKNHKDCK